MIVLYTEIARYSVPETGVPFSTLEDWHAFWLGNEPDRGLQIFPMRPMLIVAEGVQSDEIRDSDPETVAGVENDLLE